MNQNPSENGVLAVKNRVTAVRVVKFSSCGAPKPHLLMFQNIVLVFDKNMVEKICLDYFLKKNIFFKKYFKTIFKRQYNALKRQKMGFQRAAGEFFLGSCSQQTPLVSQHSKTRGGLLRGIVLISANPHPDFRKIKKSIFDSF